MNILVTGAEGFVGKNLAEKLSESKNFKVFAPSFAELDLTSTEGVAKYLSGKQIAAIVHSATVTPVGKVYPENVCELNIRMFFNLIRAMDKGTRFLNLGSGSEYARNFWHHKMKEDFFDQNVPSDGHSYAKYVISKFIKSQSEQDLVSLRIFGIYGKYEDYRFKFISNSIAKNLHQLPLVINQNSVYDYVYIDDFCRIIDALLRKTKLQFRDYNVTSEESVELTEIAALVNQVSGHKSEIIVKKEGYGTPCTGDNSRLRSEIPEFKFMSQKESISGLFQYYKANLHQIDKSDLLKDEFLQYAKTLSKKI